MIKPSYLEIMKLFFNIMVWLVKIKLNLEHYDKIYLKLKLIS